MEFFHNQQNFMEKVMKKTSLVFVTSCLIFVLFSFGCSKTEEKPVVQEQIQEQTQEAEEIPATPVKKVLTTKEAIALYPGTPLYTENDEGKMVYVDEVAKGDKILVYYDGAQIDSKNAIRRLNNGTEDPFDFIHVATEFSGDKNYWTRGLFLAKEHSYVAVVTEDAYIYTSPQSFDVTDSSVKQGDLVAMKGDINPETVFTAVTIYNGADNGKEVYLKTDFLSTHPADVIAVQTMNKVNSIEKIDPVVENKLLEIFVDMDVSPTVWNFLFAGEN